MSKHKDTTEAIEISMNLNGKDRMTVRTCGYCGSDHGCGCRRELEQENRNEEFYRGRQH